MLKRVPGFFRKNGYIVKRFFRIKSKKKQILKGVQTEIGPRYFSKCNGALKSTFSTYTKIKLNVKPGAAIKFTFTPRSYLMFLSKNYVETLNVPPEIVSSDSAWVIYRHLCGLIHKHEQTMGLFAESWEKETDIYLWIKPYEEPIVERDMNGVLQRRIRKATKKPSRLRGRTLLVQWMMENSDWQEQLVLHYWNLPREGTRGETLLPWFTLEVEYREGARKRLCNKHHEYFCAIEAAEGGYGCSMVANRSINKSMSRNPRALQLGGDLEIGLELAVETTTVPKTSLTEDGSSGSFSIEDLDSLYTSREPTTPGSEESITDDNAILLGDGLMTGSGNVSVKSVDIRPISCASMSPHIGKIEEHKAPDIGVGEVVFGDEGVSV
ncbi:uncharacterized protein LAJ45_00595 [Morchella importuna]|uniref:uncharacterized protein n=1 Tax=Morchella importuna TaxID=1174673 RepID=UPI001E8E751E|nr:uncharacterized protein LAJ45_00595 [Morchella importuna]KAH8155585.1 hypothetical protein LAJ45_00595 [Morchella importuna]